MSERSHLRLWPVVLVVLVLLSGSGPARTQDPIPWGKRYERLWPGLESGTHPVGYRVEHLIDESRSFPEGSKNNRPIQVSFWYPAFDVDGRSPITLKDYFLSAATEIDFSEPDDGRRTQHLDEVREAAMEAGADAARFEYLLALETTAYRDAPAAAGPFPLVVFVPGFGAPAFQNTVACEYLASNGFVVASFPSVGRDSREMTHDETGVTAQVLDMQFVVEAVRDLAPADPQRFGLVGYSWGGLTATLAAMRGTDAGALVAIDSTIMVKKGHAFARTLRGFDPAALKTPVMLMIAAAREWPERDVSFFDELSGDATLVRFHDFKHGDFGSTIIRFFVQTLPDGGGRDVARIDAGYATACRYLLAFMDAHLRDGESGHAFLSAIPAENDIPEGSVSLERQ